MKTSFLGLATFLAMNPNQKLIFDVILYLLLFLIIAKQYKNGDSLHRKRLVVYLVIILVLLLWSLKIWWLG